MMDAPSGSRDGAINRTMDVTLDMDNIEIGTADSQSPPVTTSNSNTLSHSRSLSEIQNTHSHSRGLSESQNLLPNSPRNYLQYSGTKHFGFDRSVESIEGCKFDSSKGIRGGLREKVAPVWSGAPQTLGRSRRAWWRDIVVDVLAVGAALPFFALAGVLIRVDGDRLEENIKNILDQFIKLAATLFPLTFSVVVGRSMLKLASWHLEQGASLGLLERLMESRTVGGTLITSFRFRSITLISLGLILLWLLSPLGSQSVLRILSTSSRLNTADAKISYINTRQASYVSSPDFRSWFSAFAVIFNSALLTPNFAKNSTMDTWGNIRVPQFSSLVNVDPDDNGWRSIPPNFTPVYTSLFGIPISDLPAGNTSFNVESSYMELTCSNISSEVVRAPGSFTDPDLISTTGPFFSAQNISSSENFAVGYIGQDITSLLPKSSLQSLDNLPSDTKSKTFLPGLLLYQDFSGAENVTSIYCVPSQTYVESIVHCSKSSKSTAPECVVTAQRLSLLPHTPTTLNTFSLRQAFLSFTSLLPDTTPTANNISILQNYLINPFSNRYIQSTLLPSVSASESRLSAISLTDFGHRFSQLINTFFQGTLANATSYLQHDLPVPATLTTASSPSALSAQISTLPMSLSIPANTTTSRQTCSISYTFLTLFLLSTLAMFLSAIAAAILNRKTLGTDYLGSVSSLCREAADVEFPDVGAGLSGFERGRRYRELRVRLGDIGDVEGGFEVGTGVAVKVGRLGLGMEERVGALDRKKLYL